MPILLYSYSWFIYNFVILFLLFLVCVNKKIKKSSYFIIFVFFIIFSVYGYITADYNSYLELMKMSKVNDPLVALESARLPQRSLFFLFSFVVTSLSLLC